MPGADELLEENNEHDKKSFVIIVFVKTNVPLTVPGVKITTKLKTTGCNMYFAFMSISYVCYIVHF